MAATINFYARQLGDNNAIYHMAGSGLGFYGPGFGLSVPVGDYQDTTFVTDADGTAQGWQADNIKYDKDPLAGSQSGAINSASSGVNVLQIPNDFATVNVRFTNDSAVRVQNAQLRIFDRTDISKAASGVTTEVYETLHRNIVAAQDGLGATTWTTFSEATPGQLLTMTASPGASGVGYVGGAVDPAHTNLRHDWYFCLSASPDSIGSKKLYGMYISLEYL